MTDYITPITNRTLTDITNRTARGFFNLSDWERIDNNTAYAAEMVEAFQGITIARTVLPVRTMDNFMLASDINALVQNIINVRDAAIYADTAGYNISASFIPGGRSMNYINVNTWEKVLDVIVKRYSNLSFGRTAKIGVAVAGQRLTVQDFFREESRL